MSTWTEHVIWWHVYPLGFTGADTSGADTPDSAPRLLRLIPWLDRALELGVNGLALGPVFESSTHGYDTTDYFRIDRRLGTEAHLRELIEEAHARGIRIMLDGVFNHVGREHPAVEDPDAALVARGDDGSLPTFEGHGGLVALDHSSAAVADLVVEVMRHWTGYGVDAWRLDAAYSVPTAFWAEVLPRVREGNPELFVMGEVIHGDYAAIVRDGTLDSVTQYELWQGIWHALQEVNLHELEWALRRHDEFLETFMPYTFVGNHDVTRIASQIDDARHHAHAIVLLFLLAGTPAVYVGDEYGMRAIKEERVGGDDAIRPEFPAEPGPLDDEAGAVFELHRTLIGLRRRHPWLHRARSDTLAVENTQLQIEVSEGAGRLVVVLNLGDAPVRSQRDGRVLLGRDVDTAADTPVIGPHGWAVIDPA